MVIEYVLLRGINDSVEDGQRLVELLKNTYAMVNLIVFNPHAGTPFQRSSDEAVKAFRVALSGAGLFTTVRVSKGDDEMAACGQLGDPTNSPRPVAPSAPPAAFKDLLAGASALVASRQLGAERGVAVAQDG